MWVDGSAEDTGGEESSGEEDLGKHLEGGYRVFVGMRRLLLL